MVVKAGEPARILEIRVDSTNADQRFCSRAKTAGDFKTASYEDHRKKVVSRLPTAFFWKAVLHEIPYIPLSAAFTTSAIFGYCFGVSRLHSTTCPSP